MKNFLEKVNFEEKKVIAIDFDGVIHKNSKGFYNGKVYDDPVDGSLTAIKDLSKNYDIIIFTCKALKDRPLIEGKTGKELIIEWLKKQNINQYIKDVSYEKPRAFLYIDDKGYRFSNWQKTLDYIRELNK